MFSCIARELNKVSARSGEELVASIERSFSGVKVFWVDNVVDFWGAISSRCLQYSLSNSYAFKLKKNQQGLVVFQTKDYMHATTWFPIGRTPSDLTFAYPLLSYHQRMDSVSKFQYVVPGVLDTSSLRGTIDGYQARLDLRRSSVRFPDEGPGAATRWWRSFLQAEDARVAAIVF